MSLTSSKSKISLFEEALKSFLTACRVKGLSLRTIKWCQVSHLFYNKAMTDDERFMLEALKEAQRAFEEGEVPVGAVVIYEGKIIGRGHNRTEALQDPTAHAEIIAITAAATYLNNWRLNGAKLYVTLEPCIMCAGAAVLARLDEIIYALPDPKFGGCVSLYRIPEDQRLNHRVKIRQGPFGDKVRLLMQEFFKQKRNKDR